MSSFRLMSSLSDINFYKQQSNGWRFKFTHPPPEYSESLKLPNCMLGLPIGFTCGLNHTSKGTVTFPLLAPHGEYPQNSPWGHIRAVSVRCPCEWLGTGAFYPSALWAGGVLSSRSGRAGARLPELVAPISLEPLDGFSPFEVLWNCLAL